MKIRKFFVTTIFGLKLLSTTAFAGSGGARLQEFNSLACDTLMGRIRLDLRDQTADINIYCHQHGCSGFGKIKHHTRHFFGDTFLLEMNMDNSSNVSYMMMKVENNGTGEIFNHPKASKLSNCIRD